MGSTQKKAVLRMHDGNCLSGYLPAAGFIRRSASPDVLELLAQHEIAVTINTNATILNDRVVPFRELPKNG